MSSFTSFMGVTMQIIKIMFAYLAMVAAVAVGAFGVTLMLGTLADTLFATLGNGPAAKLTVIIFLLAATLGIGWVSWFFRKALCPCRICPWVCDE